MRHGARFLAVMWLVALVAFGGFFTVIGLATVVFDGPERFTSWLAIGLRRDGGRPDRVRRPLAPGSLTDAEEPDRRYQRHTL